MTQQEFGERVLFYGRFTAVRVPCWVLDTLVSHMKGGGKGTSLIKPLPGQGSPAFIAFAEPVIKLICINYKNAIGALLTVPFVFAT